MDERPGAILSFKTFLSFINRLLVEKAMATHSSTLAWKIPWVEEPGRLQSMGLRKVGHHWVTSLSLFPFMHWRRKWQPTPVFLPGESQGRGSLVGCCYGVAPSWTRLKQFSSSSSSDYITSSWRLAGGYSFCPLLMPMSEAFSISFVL